MACLYFVFFFSNGYDAYLRALCPSERLLVDGQVTAEVFVTLNEAAIFFPIVTGTEASSGGKKGIMFVLTRNGGALMYIFDFSLKHLKHEATADVIPSPRMHTFTFDYGDLV